MLRYKILGNSVISIDLKNGYSVIAISIWDRGENNYKTTLYLKDNGYDTLELIQEKEGFVVEADMKTLKFELTNIVENLFKDGFFERHIKNYKYMMKCFDKGNEFYEEKFISND